MSPTRFWLLPAVVCVLGTAAVAAAPERPAYQTDADLVAAVMPACVNINVRSVQAATGGPATAAVPSGVVVRDEVGAGVIIDPSGIVLTNRHVIADAYAIFVSLSDGTQLPARLVGEALAFDLAILRIDAGRPLLAAKLGDSRALRIGDGVLAIGNPQGFTGSASAGIVSALHRQLGLSIYDDLIQTDTAINRGNSGGPLFNKAGEVIGINQALYSLDQGSMGLGFAIPIDQVSFLLDNLKQFGTPRIGYLGVTGQTLTPPMAAAAGVQGGGVIVSGLEPGSPAQAAGLRIGDIVRSLDGVSVADLGSLNDAVATRADREVTLGGTRDGEPLSLPVSLKQWPTALWSTVMASPPVVRSLADLGLAFRDPTSGGSGDPTVLSVTDKSIAWRAGVRPGDIVRQVQDRAIRSVAHLGNVFEELRALGRRNALVLLGGPNGERWIDFSVSE